MKVKIDVRDNRVTDWLMDSVTPEKFNFDFRKEIVEFLFEEDFLAFKLKFMEPRGGGHDAGFYYCPYIPVFDYGTKD